MAIFEYKFPELGEGIHEGEIVKLLIKQGDIVNDESILMEVQNDKAVVEVPCPVNGTIKEVKVSEGQICAVLTEFNAEIPLCRAFKCLQLATTTKKEKSTGAWSACS